MKLRNKKTGRIGDLMGSLQSKSISVCIDYHNVVPIEYSYKSIEKLNEEWEDYTPTEPLIKDPKIRKAVRAWAEANNLVNNKLQIVPLKPSDGAYNDSGIICNGSVLMSITLIHGIGRGLRDSKKQYTITELCGEEEE